jgi:ABC-type nickel/cobalt efflux system permease component RcnA
MIILLLESLGYGLLHGLLPDEHTWPITFSYAIGNATGKKGVKSGFYFSLAFMIQRAIASELAYLFLASWLLKEVVNSWADLIVGIVMATAGIIIIRKKRYIHFHLLGHHHESPQEVETDSHVLSMSHEAHEAHTKQGADKEPDAIPTKWALIHGFIAGFGFGPFALFIYTTAAPRMTSAWLGFLPGLLFGLGTMIMLMILGGVFGASLKLTKRFNTEEIQSIGLHTGSMTLLWGGVIFASGGILGLSPYGKNLPFDLGNALIVLVMLGVAVPVLFFSIRKVLLCKKNTPIPSSP